MRIVFVNRFYWPAEAATAQLLTDLAEALAERGHEVVVVTSRTPRGAESEEVRRGVFAVRVGTTHWAGRGLTGRCADYLTFLAGAASWLLRKLRAGDRLVAMTDPPMLGAFLW